MKLPLKEWRNIKLWGGKGAKKLLLRTQDGTPLLDSQKRFSPSLCLPARQVLRRTESSSTASPVSRTLSGSVSFIFWLGQVFFKHLFSNLNLSEFNSSHVSFIFLLSHLSRCGYNLPDHRPPATGWDAGRPTGWELRGRLLRFSGIFGGNGTFFVPFNLKRRFLLKAELAACFCRNAAEGVDEQVRLDGERGGTDLHLQPGGEHQAQEHRGEDRLREWVPPKPPSGTNNLTEIR